MRHADGYGYRELTHTNDTFMGIVPEYINLEFIPERNEPLQTLPILTSFGNSLDYWSHTLGLDWSPDGAKIVTADSQRILRVYDAQTGMFIREITGFQGGDEDFPGTYNKEIVTWQPDNQRLFVHTPDAILWNTDIYGNMDTAHPDMNVFDFAMSADGSTHAYAYSNGQILVQSDEYNICLDNVLETPFGYQWQRKIVLNQNGSILAAYGYDSGIIVWNTRNGQQLLKLDNLTNIIGLAIRPDGQQLAHTFDVVTHGSEKMVRIVDIPSGEVIAELPSIYHGHTMAFSPDNRLFLRSVEAYVDPIITFYDTETYEIIERYYGAARDIAWSPDGSRFATASSTGFFIWETPGYEANEDTQEN